MSDTLTHIDPAVGDPALKDDDPIYAHIVGPRYNDDGSKTRGTDLVLEARINGTPVTALCGYVWVPSRNPENHPVCERCLAIANRGREQS